MDNAMDDLERELRNALRRIEPERDFAAIVYSQPRVKHRAPYWAIAAIVILALLIPASVLEYRARQQRQRAEEARAQLITALRITSSKLQKTRQIVIRGLNRRKSI